MSTSLPPSNSNYGALFEDGGLQHAKKCKKPPFFLIIAVFGSKMGYKKSNLQKTVHNWNCCLPPDTLVDLCVAEQRANIRPFASSKRWRVYDDESGLCDISSSKTGDNRVDSDARYWLIAPASNANTDCVHGQDEVAARAYGQSHASATRDQPVWPHDI